MNATDEIQDASGGPRPDRPAPAAYAERPPRRLAGPGRDPREKSTPLACLLSVMPGLGQVYVGYYQRGFIHILVVAGIISLLTTGELGELTPLFGLFLGFFWLYNIIDAGRRASLYNQALIGTESIELPRDFEMPHRGSILGGLVLVVAGAILLSRTHFGYSLDWVGEWWPVAPILLGVYLFAKAVQDRLSKAD